MKAKSSTFWSSRGAAPSRPGVCYAGSSRSKASPRSELRLTSSVLMVPPSEKSGCPPFMIRGSGQTIGRRTHISPYDDENVKCNASNHPDQPNIFSMYRPQFRTPSPSNATSCLAPSSRSSGRPRLRSGSRARRPPEHADVGSSLRLTDLTCQCRGASLKEEEPNLLTSALSKKATVDGVAFRSKFIALSMSPPGPSKLSIRRNSSCWHQFFRNIRNASSYTAAKPCRGNSPVHCAAS